MKPLHYERVYGVLSKYATGIDAWDIIPVPDLSGPLTHTVSALHAGRIPATYAWTEHKTKRAYGYKSYGTWTRSIVVAAKYYYTDEGYPDVDGFVPTRSPLSHTRNLYRSDDARNRTRLRPFGRIARFTWRNNYRYLSEKLSNMVRDVERDLNVSIRFKTLSNYTSIPEKVLFAFSGLADFGRNCVLLHKTMGSYFVVGEMLTDLPVDFTGSRFQDTAVPTAPEFAVCRECRRCIDACPTGALLGQGNIDINSCLQYISENLVFVPPAYRDVWGNRLYGCSTCMDVCPHNSGLEPVAEKHSVGHVGTGEDLVTLLSYDDAQWQKRFRNNQIIIRDRLAIVKNALLCFGNAPSEEALEPLTAHLTHPAPVIRSLAAWALGKLGAAEARTALERRLAEEEVRMVREEIERVL
jgi:epoxyqueuosine reductase